MRNHALVDGNRRLGWFVAIVLFGLDGVELDAPQHDAHELVVTLAAGTTTHHEAAKLLGGWV